MQHTPTPTAQQTSAPREDADTLLTDPAFLLNAHPDDVTALFAHARSRPARAMVHLYRTALRHGPTALPWLLDLHTRRTGIPGPTSVPATDNTAAWRATWTSSPQRRQPVQDSGARGDKVATGIVNGRPVAVTGSRDGSLRVYDLLTGRMTGAPLVGHTCGVGAVATVMIDGRPVAVTGHYDNKVRVWDLTTGRQVGEPLIGHQDEGGPRRYGVGAVATAMVDGRPVAVTSSNSDETVRIWDLSTRRQIGEPLTGRAHWIQAVATATVDGRPVAVTNSNNHTVRVWDLTTRRQIGEPLTGHTKSVWAVATTVVDGRPVAVTGSEDHTVRVWDLTTRQQIGEPLTSHTNGVGAVATAVMDGRPVAVTVDRNATMRVWDLATGRQVGEPLTGHTESVWAVATAMVDGRPVAVTASPLQVRELDEVHTDAPAANGTAAAHTKTVHAATMTTVGGRDLLLTGGEDRKIKIWDPAGGNGAGEGLGRAHTGPVRAVTTFSLDGQPTAVTGSGRTLRIWNLTTGRLIREQSTPRAVRALATHTVDSKPVILAAVDTWLRVIDPETGRASRLPHPAKVTAVTTGHLDDRPIAVTRSEDNLVRVWDLATGEQTGPALEGDSDFNWGCGLATAVVGGRPIAVISSAGTVRVWDLTAGRQIRELLTGDSYGMQALATAVVDRRPVAVTGGWDKSVRVWDLTTRQQTGEPLTGHTGSVEALATTVLDGRPVAVTGSDDKTVRLWDLTTRRQIGKPLIGHTRKVEAVATAMVDGRPVAITGSEDHTVRVWDLTTRQQIGKPLTDHRREAEAVPDSRPGTTTATSSGGQAGEDLGGTHTGTVRAITPLHLDGQPTVVTGSGRRLGIWDLDTGRLVHEESTVRAVLALATHTVKGKPVVLAAVDTWLRVIDPETGRARRLPHPATVTAVTTGHLDGRPVAITTTSARTVHTWDLTTRKPLTPARTRPGTVHAVHLTSVADRPTLLTALGRWLRLYDPHTGAPSSPLLTGHTRPITALTTTTIRDTPVAVTGSADTTLRTWNLTTPTPTPLGPPLPFPHPITTLTPTPDGDLIVTHGPETTRLTPRP